MKKTKKIRKPREFYSDVLYDEPLADIVRYKGNTFQIDFNAAAIDSHDAKRLLRWLSRAIGFIKQESKRNVK